MRKALLATASGAALLAAGPALAADKITVGLSGYMEQWVGGTDITEGTYYNTKEGASLAWR